MRKILIVFVIVLFSLCSCTGGSNRNIEVRNQITGKTVWSYSGKSYIDSNSSVGNVTIIYYDANGKSKKADFIGTMFGVSSIEL